MKKIMCITFLAISLLLIGCSAEDDSESEPAQEEIETKIVGYGDEEYEQMKVGMSIEEIDQIIGFEGELLGETTENGVTYETYQWKLNKDATIGADFENGKLVLKGGWNPRDKWRQ